jgi:hypothetical protein
VSLETQVQTRLEAVSNLTDAVSTRIYRYIRARKTPLPCVVWRRMETEIVHHAAGETETRWARLEVISIADDMDTVRTVADAVAEALSGWSDSGGTVSISMCHQQSDLDNVIPPDHGNESTEYQVIQDYRLSYYEAA